MATLLQKDGTVYDLEEAELCYGEGCCWILLYYSTGMFSCVCCPGLARKHQAVDVVCAVMDPILHVLS